MDNLLENLILFLEKNNNLGMEQLRKILIFIGENVGKSMIPKALITLKKFVGHKKRRVRQAASYSINKCYL
jgi:AAA15 family ATPase/GTPase